MKQATRRRQTEDNWSLQINQRLREGAFILLCSLGIYFFLALVSYHETDPAWSHSGQSAQITNIAGKTGAFFSDILLSLFGYLAYLFPFILGTIGVFIYRAGKINSYPSKMGMIRSFGLFITLLSSCGFSALHLNAFTNSLPMNAGGVLGEAIKSMAVHYCNPVGASLIFIALFLIGITLFTGLSWMQLTQKWGSWLLLKMPILKEFTFPHLKKAFSLLKNKWAGFTFAKTKNADAIMPTNDEPNSFLLDEPLPPIRIKKKVIANKPALRKMPAPEIVIAKREDKPKTPAKKKPVTELLHAGETALPSLQLLDQYQPPNAKLGYTGAQLQELSRCVESRLLEFGVQASVVGVYPGPVITRFELNLAAGIKVNKITGLAKDLARSLSVISVRVVEVIPGKSVVGLEIPNAHRELVRLKEVLEDTTYQDAESPLCLVLGKDISGRPMVVDLAKMPHLLVAGTTGSGKSVGINAMLLSILYKATPREVRLIMIDPKMLELAIYDNIPHLLTPVVTDMKDAANALRWCVGEMDRRYQLMAAVGVRNLNGYNQKVRQAIEAGYPLVDPFIDPKSNVTPEPLTELPFIVVVVDEFADMIMVVGKKVEELIARIAQKARAAGIHLILATQRPSVDVITGLIKANIPTRIAFQVSSRIDSRTILDQSGAEQLLGHGDMLYLPPGVGVPHRIHGAFVSDEEVHKVVNMLRKSGKPEYIESVVQSGPISMGSDDQDYDALYDEAVMIVTESRKASISLIQRRLKIGYNRAARLVEQMEADGVVSAVQSNGSREVIAPPPIQ